MVGSRSADEFVHPAFFYRGTAEYLEGTVPFIRDGLAADEPVALAVPGPNLRLILAELGTDAERVRLLDMTRAGRNPGRIIPSVLLAFADAHPAQRVRIIGEHTWAGRSTVEYPACAQYEALINMAFAGRPVTILCPYDAGRVGPQTLADAEAGHPLLIDASGQRASTTYAPERVIADYNRPFPAAVGPSLTLDATNQELVRQFASDHASRLGLDGDHAELKLIVGELTANSLRHGGGTGTLSIWAHRGYLVCEVRDAGQIMDPLVGRRGADPMRTGDRSLLLVNYLSDLAQQHTGPKGTTTRVYLKLPPLTNPREPVPAAPRAPRRPAFSTPLPWQTYEALHAAERFGRYLPQDVAASPGRPAATSAERGKDSRPIEPVLEALTAVEALSRVVDRWRARLVRVARTHGAPWNEIGQSLGVSKPAAHERYGHTRRRKPDREAPGPGGPLPPAQGM